MVVYVYNKGFFMYYQQQRQTPAMQVGKKKLKQGKK